MKNDALILIGIGIVGFWLATRKRGAGWLPSPSQDYYGPMNHGDACPQGYYPVSLADARIKYPDLTELFGAGVNTQYCLKYRAL